MSAEGARHRLNKAHVLSVGTTERRFPRVRRPRPKCPPTRLALCVKAPEKRGDAMPVASWFDREALGNEPDLRQARSHQDIVHYA